MQTERRKCFEDEAQGTTINNAHILHCADEIQGYEADNANIELLRLRNFTIGQKVSDQDILSAGGLDRVMELIKVMHPFVSS